MTSDPIAERAAEIIWRSRSQPRVAALSEDERQEWARRQAERELASVRYLPGKLSWAQIEGAYRALAAAQAGPCVMPPLHVHRRRGAQPSRPEVAHKLDKSAATLDRACIAAGRGKLWPPRGL